MRSMRRERIEKALENSALSVCKGDKTMHLRLHQIVMAKRWATFARMRDVEVMQLCVCVCVYFVLYPTDISPK